MKRPLLLVLAIMAACAAFSCSSSKTFEGVQNVVIQVEPSPISLESVAPGDTSWKDIQISHVGDEGVLKLDRIFIESDSDEFLLTEPEISQLSPGESVQLTVSYKPTDLVINGGILRIATNATNAVAGYHDVSIEVQQVGDYLKFFPSRVDFGDVRGHSQATEEVSLKKEGTKRVRITNLKIKGGSSPDFSLDGLPEPLPVMGAGDEIVFNTLYTPTDGDSDTGTIMVVWEAEDDPNDNGVVEALCTGTEISPNLIIVPGEVDFGWIELEENYEQTITIKNSGQAEAIVADLSVVPGPDVQVSLDQFTIENIGGEGIIDYVAGQDVTLLPNEKLIVKLHFHPTEVFPATYMPIARFEVSQAEDVEGTSGINIFGRLSNPDIEVVPPDVDFSFVATGFNVSREVTIFNKGTSDLVIEGIEITLNDTGEFGLVTDEDFGPLATTPVEHAIPPDGTVTFEVEFTNSVGSTGSVFGTLVIHSNDPMDEDLEMTLKASRAQNPECKPVFVPAVLNYGVVPHGQTKTLTMALKNAGSGYCTFKSAKVTDCSGFAGMMVSCDPNSMFFSSHYKLTQMPMPVQDGLEPGQTMNLPVRFTPPTTASLFDFESYPALMTVTYEEPYSAGGAYTEHMLPAGTGGMSSTQPNIQGKSGTSRISVLPDHLDFGIVTVGCYSQTMKVSLYNTGNAPLAVNDLYIDPTCPSLLEFKIKEQPPLPQNVDPQNPLVVKVVYLPQDLGPDSCTLIIESSDQDEPQFTVPLEGEGTFETEHTDIFTQITGQDVDILFSIDSSGSMSEERDNVADNITDLTVMAGTWSNDYQLAVIGMNIDAGQCDNAGTIQNTGGTGPALIMHNTATGFSETVSNIDDGGCAPDSQEAGLEAAHLALTLPLNHDTDTPCSGDAACTAPDTCIDGFCGGHNRGFLRDDAALEIILISDEEDQSPATPEFYIDFFNSIKGFANPNLMHVHAIVGDKNSGCSLTSGGQSGDAAAGNRYIAVQEATGGVFASICDSDFGDELNDIGNIAFGLKKQFFLTRTADPTTVKVWINDELCSGGYVYDQASNSIIFDENGACMPNTGDEIKVWYKTVCYNS